MKRNPPPGNVRRVVYINKNLRGITPEVSNTIAQFESFQEIVLLLLLRRNKLVVKIISQPFTLTDDVDNIEVTYTPDFRVEFSDGHIEIHEVTRSERESKDTIQRRVKLMERHCKRRRWKYVQHNELTLPKEPEITNLQALFQFEALCFHNESVSQAVCQYINSVTGPVNLGEVIDYVRQTLNLPESEIKDALCYMLWWDQITTDMIKLLFPLDRRTLYRGTTLNRYARVWRSNN